MSKGERQRDLVVLVVGWVLLVVGAVGVAVVLDWIGGWA